MCIRDRREGDQKLFQHHATSLSRKLQDLVLLEQRTDGIGRLRAVGNPLLGLLGVDLHLCGLLARIIGADLLDETAVAGETDVYKRQEF